MFDGFWRISPGTGSTEAAIVSYEFTREFYREMKYREAHEAYCQWYQETAKKHRQELQRMQGDVNILGWFYEWRN